MSQVRFDQILYQVLKYAPTQLLNATQTRIETFYGVRQSDDGSQYIAYAKTFSTKIYVRKNGVRVLVDKPKVLYDTFIFLKRYKTRRSTIVLSCSCDDFKYRHEVALYKRGGAEIEYSNGMRPKITNPKYRFTCCKHCLRFYEYLSHRLPSVFEPNTDLTQAIGASF